MRYLQLRRSFRVSHHASSPLCRPKACRPQGAGSAVVSHLRRAEQIDCRLLRPLLLAPALGQTLLRRSSGPGPGPRQSQLPALLESRSGQTIDRRPSSPAGHIHTRLADQFMSRLPCPAAQDFGLAPRLVSHYSVCRRPVARTSSRSPGTIGAWFRWFKPPAGSASRTTSHARAGPWLTWRSSVSQSRPKVR